MIREAPTKKPSRISIILAGSPDLKSTNLKSKLISRAIDLSAEWIGAITRVKDKVCGQATRSSTMMSIKKWYKMIARSRYCGQSRHNLSQSRPDSMTGTVGEGTTKVRSRILVMRTRQGSQIRSEMDLITMGSSQRVTPLTIMRLASSLIHWPQVVLMPLSNMTQILIVTSIVSHLSYQHFLATPKTQRRLALKSKITAIASLKRPASLLISSNLVNFKALAYLNRAIQGFSLHKLQQKHSAATIQEPYQRNKEVRAAVAPQAIWADRKKQHLLHEVWNDLQ